ncbi:SIMPL domain-containing protein [Cryomorphaceae bacterium 1068]|nr:SIMPL domain-containing protein [Cryomorphaceae bacterium 1068]
MKILQTATLLLLFSACAFGQNTTNAQIENPYIEVTGTAEKEVIPDEIYISITLRERPSGRDQITVEEQEGQLKDALKEIGVSTDNLFLSDANADYINVKWSKKEVVSVANYLLMVDSASTVGRVFEKLDELKIDDANISKVSHSKIREFKKEVHIMAIKAAKDKADYLLAAIGEKTGKALVVKETYEGVRDDRYSNVQIQDLEVIQFNLEGRQESKNKVLLQFKKIKLQASIYVKFGIEQ